MQPTIIFNVINHIKQGVQYDKSQEIALASQTVHLVMEFNCLHRHTHWQNGGSDIGCGIHDGWSSPDYHGGRCHCGYSLNSYWSAFGSQGALVATFVQPHEKKGLLPEGGAL